MPVEIPPLPLPSALEFWLEVSQDLATISDGLARMWGTLVDGVVDSSGNPVKIADAIVRFATGTVALIVEAPFRRHWRTAKKNVEAVAKHRVMTPVQALQWFEDTLIDTPSFFIGVSDNSLLAWVLQRITIWLYHTFKRIKLIFWLFGIKSEADALEVVAKILRGKLRIIKIKAFLAVLTLPFYVLGRIAGLIMAFRGPFEVNRYTLPQDNPIVRDEILGRRRVRQ